MSFPNSPTSLACSMAMLMCLTAMGYSARTYMNALDAPIGDHIEEFEVATPQTFARYTGARGGSIYGYEQEPWDSIMPRLMSLQDDKHVEGLEFAGGHSFRCHGYLSSFMSGQTVGLMAYRDMLERGEIAQ